MLQLSIPMAHPIVDGNGNKPQGFKGVVMAIDPSAVGNREACLFEIIRFASSIHKLRSQCLVGSKRARTTNGGATTRARDLDCISNKGTFQTGGGAESTAEI